jgi:hypothetical protein
LEIEFASLTVILNTVLPSWLILVTLVTVLFITAIRTVSSGLKIFRTERQQLKRLQASGNSSDEEKTANFGSAVRHVNASTAVGGAASIEIAEMLRDEAGTPWHVVFGELFALVSVRESHTWRLFL